MQGVILLLLMFLVLGTAITLGIVFSDTTSTVDNSWMQYLPEPPE